MQQIISAIEHFFAQSNFKMVDVPILQPADPFLDVVGEDLRRRIFMTENENGDSLCLRPEFTIPVCLSHIETKRKTPQRYAYLGEVFRQRRKGLNAASGFYQAGLEDLGDDNEAFADARSLKNAMALLQTVAPQLDYLVLIGDHAIFECVLSAFGLPDFWQRRLVRCFGHNAQLRSVLADLAKAPPPLPSLPASMLEKLTQGETQALADLIEIEMTSHGLSPTASRTAQEIAHRLQEKNHLAHLKFDQDKLDILEKFLTIEVPLSQAVEELTSFAKSCHINLGTTLSKFAARNQAFMAAGIELDRLRYDAAFGRPLDYYTSFVYEIRDQAPQLNMSAPHIVIGGGRYDRLLQLLGSHAPIPAVGFSLWLDQLKEAQP